MHALPHSLLRRRWLEEGVGVLLHDLYGFAHVRSCVWQRPVGACKGAAPLPPLLPCMMSEAD